MQLLSLLSAALLVGSAAANAVPEQATVLNVVPHAEKRNAVAEQATVPNPIPHIERRQQRKTTAKPAAKPAPRAPVRTVRRVVRKPAPKPAPKPPVKVVVRKAAPAPKPRVPVAPVRRTGVTGGDAPSSAWEMDCLITHNTFRARVGVPALSWSSKLEASARDWANQLNNHYNLDHDPRNDGYGENLNRLSNWGGVPTCKHSITTFWNERFLYRGQRIPGGNFHAYGHYTQVVWDATRQVGCAQSSGRYGYNFVCKYWPAGNVMGQTADTYFGN